MSRIIYALGCGLLLLAPAGCARQSPPIGEAQGSAAQGKMDDTSKMVANTAAQANGWNPADVFVDELPEGSAGDCRLFGAASANVLPSITKTYAVIGGRQVVSPGDPDALVRVLDACGPDASASLWAQAIAAFHPDVLPGRVVRSQENISSTAHKWAIQDGGYEFHPPRFVGEDPRNRVVEFFMTDVEGNRLFVVRGTRSGDDAVEVVVGPAGSDH